LDGSSSDGDTPLLPQLDGPNDLPKRKRLLEQQPGTSTEPIKSVQRKRQNKKEDEKGGSGEADAEPTQAAKKKAKADPVCDHIGCVFSARLATVVAQHEIATVHSAGGGPGARCTERNICRVVGGHSHEEAQAAR
jgi:hypothetical protein